jgi:hypothetical protein
MSGRDDRRSALGAAVHATNKAPPNVTNAYLRDIAVNIHDVAETLDEIAELLKRPEPRRWWQFWSPRP